MNKSQKFPWLHPLKLAALIPFSEENWVLLYSGMRTKYSGRYSFLGMHVINHVENNFSELEQKLTTSCDNITNTWFGYFGYGLKNELENLSFEPESFIKTPDLWFANFGLVVIFDHELQDIIVHSINETYCNEFNELYLKAKKNNEPDHENILQISNINSNMNRAEYLHNVAFIKAAILRGDLYQANLTRKFYGEITTPYQPLNLFIKLCNLSPSTYSAFIKIGDLHIISSSPERFICVDKHGNANTRPIKGSAARYINPEQDIDAIKTLQTSEKDQAENLMIVDLSRNDLAKNCLPGSVKVDELFAVESFKSLHHLVSSISGQKKPSSSTINLIKGCFPPGSMTGAPKIKAMQICSQLEKIKRGIYSGAIGWLGVDGSADLSVVIRTIILKGNKFEFQVGGAIVHDSIAEAEFNETMLKAKGVAGALGIDIKLLENM